MDERETSPGRVGFGKGYVANSARTDAFVGKSTRMLFGAPHGVPQEHDGLSGLVGRILSWVSALDQSITNTCVGWSFAANIFLSLAAQGVEIPFPSPTGIYTFARARARETRQLEHLIDRGCIPSLAVEGMQLFGVPSVEQWPFDPATVNDEPDLEELLAAWDHRVPDHFYIDSSGDAAVMDVKAALAQDRPVSVGTRVDNAFEYYYFDRGKPEAVTAPKVGEDLGGHMLLLLGYRLGPFGRTWFRGLNWWGAGWGDGGFFWADEEWVKQATDRTVLQVQSTGRRR